MMPTRRRPHLVFAVTHPATADRLMRGQLAWLRERGFDVTVVSSPGPELDRVREREGVPVVGIPMRREISPLADIVALTRLTKLFTELRPDLVAASTPKAGLLATVAATATGCPIRLYTIRGLRLETSRGLRRLLLAAAERVTTGCATDIAGVSDSLVRAARAAGVLDGPCRVPGFGASTGVDLDRFAPAVARARGREWRREIGIPDRAPLIGFIGRPVPDKGVHELLDAFEIVRHELPEARLAIVGSGFAGDHPDPRIAVRLRSTAGVFDIGSVDDTVPVYGAINVLAFPSHREGLPNAPLEAGACGVPAVVAKATGSVEVIEPDRTGRVVAIGDSDGLARALLDYLRDEPLRRAHGDAARARVAERWSRGRVWTAWSQLYVDLLAERGGPPPAPDVPPRSADTVVVDRSRPRSPGHATWRGATSKRTFDIAVALTLLVVLSPVLAVVALLVRIRMGRPVWFRQQRPGRRGRPFTLFKFRTMRDATSADGHPLPDDQRLTGFGRFLRASSLDELPELINVLRGDMSLVGPRPLLMAYLPRYSDRQRRRHDVRPGITGWAQIHGRNALDWAARLEMDVWYVENQTFLLDLAILFRTPVSVLTARGVAAEGHATMPEFTGTPPAETDRSN